ncbi:AAA-domain-containing protein [Cryphonectria parasitica EP155]|uniref:Peroxisomal ATPase PEX1 n=1 Tax=Cryphonectria parasitica (strain ATCC 38755 / EP155) TaxID=660469 RepID=A0A9P4Y3X0_CRYP1|nr:AAA-domain-containing protein [Cryphonectria parasitica EP155]KAF3766228.1 AAA-domain-containing protein [Cryphonectria parasitica EP155]
MPISLRQGLDRDVYQIVRKFEDDYINETGRQPRVTISVVYEYIQRSNSSLKRQKKRPLEDAIERVLAVRREEDKEDRDSDEELEKELQTKAAGAKRTREERDASLLNKQLTRHWNFKASGSGSGTGPSSTAALNSAASSTGTKTPTAPDAMDLDAGSAPPVDRQPNGEAKPKRRRKDLKEIDRSPPQDISLADLAGLDKALERLRRSVFIPLRCAEVLSELGYQPNDGVLLHGPSGCGKTALAHALAAELGVAFIPVSTPSLVGGTSGESEKNIRDIFDEAMRLAPCLVFLDELDSIAGKKDSAQKAMEGRIVTEICHGMDRLGRRGGRGGNVVVLAATNRPDSIDPTVRRRFGVEVDIGMPNEAAREKILQSMTRDLKLAEDVDFAALARLTPGYVGADLRHVVSAAVFDAAEACIGRGADTLPREPDQPSQEALPADDDLTMGSITEPDLTSAQRLFRFTTAMTTDIDITSASITMAHLTTAISAVQPAAKREGFSAIPDTTWAHVGALADVRKKLEMSIIGPIKYPERFARVGIKSAAGILLWGPPGCGKTLVAKAVANESKANFISIKGPELLNKYVGESERAVRSLFARARSSAPCILFFDEMDALVPKRDDSLSDASSRVVNALLTEMDGVEDRSGIYVVGATNRPDCIDPAIRRPGRLGTSVFVGLPAREERVDILRAIYWNTIAGGKKDAGAAEEEGVAKVEERLRAIALDGRCEGFSGADLGNLMQAAAQASLERTYYHGGGDISVNPGGNGGSEDEDEITAEDWEKALNEVKPSVKDDGRYDPAQFDKVL